VNETLQQLFIVLVGSLGVAVAGSGIAILWYRLTAKGPVERDTVFFPIKLFFGIGAFGIVIFLILKFL
jgi:hypothetical protein